MKKLKNIPPSFIKECLNYNPSTGIVTWKTRPRSHFKTGRVFAIWNTRFAGKPITYINYHGYVKLVLTYNDVKYGPRAHQIAWCLFHGRWPKDEIDHKNGNRADNRISNLREVTTAQRNQNQKLYKNNTTGFPGIEKVGRKWRATARKTYIGMFDTPQAAYEACKAAKAKHYSQFTEQKDR
jgi:hypothetical protein